MSLTIPRPLTVAAVVAVALLLIGVFCLPRLEAPAWEVDVVDAGGEPVEGIYVKESRQDYSCERTNQIITKVTDKHGRVFFAPVYVRPNLLRCAQQTFFSLSEGVHASLGPHDYIDVAGLVCVTDKRGYCIDWTGTPKSVRTHVVIPK